MRPEYDVIVVGAGPAGIAAAVRVRWVKRHLAIPCKVALIDPAPLGGLSVLGTTNLIGPGWIYSAKSLRPNLTRDVDRFRIPHIRRRVVRVERCDATFRVSLAGSENLRTRAVILCPGMKLLSGEARFWKRGITATSLGIQPAAQKVKGWLADPRNRHIVFVGSVKLDNLFRFVAQHRRSECRVTFVVEPTNGHGSKLARAGELAGASVVFGTVVELCGRDRLQSISIVADDDRRHVLEDVDLMVIDFLSYEIVPARSFICDELDLDANGFVVVDRRQQTNITGLFAAGDVTGTPAAVAPAISEGIVAGFEAYRYVYQQKFLAEPALFAYYGVDREFGTDIPEMPSYAPDAYGPELLSDPALIFEVASRRFWGEDRRIAMAMIERVSKSRSILAVQHLAEETSADVATIQRILERFLRFKQITLQPLTEYQS